MATHTPASDRRRRRREGPGRLLVAFLFALLAHVAFLGVVVLLSYIQVKLPESERRLTRPPSAVSMRPLTAEQWAKNRGESRSSKTQANERPRVQEKKEEKVEKKPPGQVVAVAPGNDQKAPDAKYAAERDNKVAKETRAKEQTPDYRNAMPQRTAPKSRDGSERGPEEQPQIAGNNGTGTDSQPMSPGDNKPAFEIPDVQRKQEIALKTEPDTTGPGMQVNNREGSEDLQGNAKRLNIQPGRGAGERQGSSGRMGLPGVATLMPSEAVMNKLIGAAPNDHLKDVEEGEGTFLNTREWKYASFFNRVKQGVGMHWDPNSQLRRRDPTGSIYSGRDRYTLLEVTLDQKGMVQDIRVEKSSGLDFLDLEAISSFRRAQPFPNPPAGLLDGDATVRFSFGFYLEMGGGPRMRLFRQSN